MRRNLGWLPGTPIIMVLMTTLLMTGGCSLITTYWGLRDIPVEELKTEFADSDSEFIPVNNMMVHVRDEGSGPVLVLLHGILSSLQTWDGWAPVLSQDYRVIRLDLPGFGLTGLPGNDAGQFNVGLVNDTVLKVLAARNVKKATFIGNSFGGYVSWHMALDHPELVERVVLIDPVSFPQKWPFVLNLVRRPPLRLFAPFTIPRYSVAIGLYQVYGDDGRLSEKTITRYHHLMLRPGNRDAMLAVLDWLESMEQPFDAEPESDIYNIKQPLMTMWGKKDAWVPYDPIGKEWEAAYPDQPHAVYADAGHIPMEEIPSQTLMDLLAFLKSTDKKLGYPEAHWRACSTGK